MFAFQLVTSPTPGYFVYFLVYMLVQLKPEWKLSDILVARWFNINEAGGWAASTGPGRKYSGQPCLSCEVGPAL